MGRSVTRALALGAVVVSGAALGACENASDRRRVDAINQALIATATPCPAPATCSRKMSASGIDVSVCTPDPDGQSYSAGDVVVMKEMKNHDMIGRIVAHRRAVYDVSFAPDDQKFERTADRILGRVCR